jgi:UDP-N-acetyl-D-mannosaminuronate dehydrogenase
MVELADRTNHEMHRYIAKKALSIIKHQKPKARILILGVAYKAGISDIRETPVAYLRDYLKSLGHQVLWSDPFVESWEETEPASTITGCDVAILTVNQPGIDLTELLSNDIPVLDCTNSYTNVEGIVSI